VNPKMIFAKNQELILLELKGKPTSVPAKSAGACVKSRKKNFEGLREETRVDMCILYGVLFMWGIVPCFPFAVLLAAS
jgi:hypothetical protein